MLPSAGYFKAIPCPFYQSTLCVRPYCQFKHVGQEDKHQAKETTASTSTATSSHIPVTLASGLSFSYEPTPIPRAGNPNYSVPTYSPTPIDSEPTNYYETEDVQQNKSKDLAVSSVKTEKHDSSRKRKHDSDKKTSSSESSSRSHKSRKEHKSSSSSGRKEKERHHHSSTSSSRHHHHKSKSKSKDKDRDQDRDRDDRDRDRRKEKEKEKHRESKSKKPANVEAEESDHDVQSFLDAMDEIDKTISSKSTAVPDKPTSPIKIKSPSIDEDSFLAALSQPDKSLESTRPVTTGKTRISAVKSSDQSLTSAMIARKKNPNSRNPVQAMLNRFNAVRKESQTRDLEEQLSALTGEEVQPSTSSRESRLPEGLRKSQVQQRKAHVVKNKEVLRRPIIETQSSGQVPSNVRQRYLDTIVEECLKIYPANSSAAYQRAEKEERTCSERSKTRSIYLNLVVNAIKKLRNEAKEVAAANPRAAASSSTATSPSASNGNSKVQPNMITTHLQVLAGKAGTRGTWSIESAVKNVPSLTREMFYKVMKRYILTPDQLEANNYPSPDMLVKWIDERCKVSDMKTCSRCQKAYRVDDDGHQIVKQECVHHWGKLRKVRGSRATGFLNVYSCCKGEAQSEGCEVGQSHVTADIDPTGFVKTLSSKEEGKERVYALDCEMCYTTNGIELTRVTVVDEDGNSAYESFVQPDNKILDFNSRFSGVKAEDLVGVTTSLRDVQAILMSMFSSDTILCGHSLESDLKALKLIHFTVVDTSLVFPHKLGLPYKRALRTLSGEILQRIIQEDVGGHDPKEDALAALDLMKYKVKEDLKKL